MLSYSFPPKVQKYLLGTPSSLAMTIFNPQRAENITANAILRYIIKSTIARVFENHAFQKPWKGNSGLAARGFPEWGKRHKKSTHLECFWLLCAPPQNGNLFICLFDQKSTQKGALIFLLKRKEIDSLPPHEYKYLAGTPLTFLLRFWKSSAVRVLETTLFKNRERGIQG